MRNEAPAICLDCDPNFYDPDRENRHRPDRDQAIWADSTRYGMNYGVAVVDVVSQVCMGDSQRATGILVGAHRRRQSRYDGKHSPMLSNQEEYGFCATKQTPAIGVSRLTGWSTFHKYETSGPILFDGLPVLYSDYGYESRGKATRLQELEDTTPNHNDPDSSSAIRDMTYLIAKHLWCNALTLTGQTLDDMPHIGSIYLAPQLSKKARGSMHQIIEFMQSYFGQNNPEKLIPWDILDTLLLGSKVHTINKLLMISISDELIRYYRQQKIPLLYSENGHKTWIHTPDEPVPTQGTASLTSPLRNWTGLINQFNLVAQLKTGAPLLDASELETLLHTNEGDLQHIYSSIVERTQCVLRLG